MNAPLVTLDDCVGLFHQVESFSRRDEDEKRLRRLSLIDAGWVSRLVTLLRHTEVNAEKIASLAALSELAFGVCDSGRLASFFDPSTNAIAAITEAFVEGSADPEAALEIRVWGSIALCNTNSEVSNGLEQTWACGAVKAAVTFLAAYLAAKDAALADGVCVSREPIKDFSRCPEYENALLSIAAEPFVTPTLTGEGSATDSTPRVSVVSEVLRKSMSVGPFRVAMNCLGLLVMFSREESMTSRIREMRLADCSPYYQLLRERGNCGGGGGASTAGTASEEAIAVVANHDPGRVHHLCRLASSPLFLEDTTALDLALHAVESLDPFTSHIAASVLAYLAGADETTSFLLSDGEGTASVPALSSPLGTVSDDAVASPMRSPSTRVRQLQGKASFAKAHNTVHRGLPPQAVAMLLEAAGAALRNETYRGFAAYRKLFTYLRPLAVIAIADANKETIRTQGGVAIALQSLSHPDERSRRYAAQLLWLLAFNREAKREMRAANAMEALKAAAKAGTGEARMNALGALWQLRAKDAPEPDFGFPASSASPATLASAPSSFALPSVVEGMEGVAAAEDSESESEDEANDSSAAASSPFKPSAAGGGHVMLSYCWSEQPLVVAVKQELSRLGYQVWLDLEAMTGSTLEAMANAVEQASAVIVFCSQKYRQSANCRSEAEYAFRLGKRIIPVMAQGVTTATGTATAVQAPPWQPDGWLGLVIGTRLYFDFSGCAVAPPLASTAHAGAPSPASILEAAPRFVTAEASTLFQDKMRLLLKELGSSGKASVVGVAPPNVPRSAKPSRRRSRSPAPSVTLTGHTDVRSTSTAVAISRVPSSGAGSSSPGLSAEEDLDNTEERARQYEAAYTWALKGTESHQVATALRNHRFDLPALQELKRLASTNEALALKLCREELGLSKLGPALRLLAALRQQLEDEHDNDGHTNQK